jgi:hypothetical protein
MSLTAEIKLIFVDVIVVHKCGVQKASMYIYVSLAACIFFCGENLS